MNGVDAGLGIVLFLFAWRGFWRGLAREFFGLLGVILGIVCAAAFSPALAVLLEPYLPVAVGKIVAFAMLFALTDMAANLVAIGVETIAGFLLFSFLNRAGGAMLAAAKGAVVLAAVLLLVSSRLPGTAAESAVRQSAIGPRLVTLASGVARAVGLEVVPGGS